MGYRLHREQPIDREVRRIADQQLDLAITGLRTVGDPKANHDVHAARRHVKKVRALIRLVRPALGGRFKPLNRRLRAINRILAPVADGRAAVETLAQLVGKYPRELSPDSLHEIRTQVLRREALLDEEPRSPIPSRRRRHCYAPNETV